MPYALRFITLHKYKVQTNTHSHTNHSILYTPSLHLTYTSTLRELH